MTTIKYLILVLTPSGLLVAVSASLDLSWVRHFFSTDADLPILVKIREGV